jgi:hypothetical protein
VVINVNFPSRHGTARALYIMSYPAYRLYSHCLKQNIGGIPWLYWHRV